MCKNEYCRFSNRDAENVLAGPFLKTMSNSSCVYAEGRSQNNRLHNSSAGGYRMLIVVYKLTVWLSTMSHLRRSIFSVAGNSRQKISIVGILSDQREPPCRCGNHLASKDSSDLSPCRPRLCPGVSLERTSGAFDLHVPGRHHLMASYYSLRLI